LQKHILIALVLGILVFGCVSQGRQQPSGNAPGTAYQDKGESDAGNGAFAGKWRSFSDTKYTPLLQLNEDGTWSLEGSSGTWQAGAIEDSDWARWGISSYGPAKKITLNGWNNGVADGPVEESDGRVDFFWIIYDVTLEGEQRLAQIKFGHSNYD